MLNSIHPLSETLIAYLSKVFKYKEVQKGKLLLAEGETCQYLYYIDEGLVRCYYYRDNKEICAWFQTEGNAVISFESFYGQTPSTEYIQALEDCKIYRVSRADLYYMYNTYIESNIYRAVLTEHYYRIIWKCFYNVRLTSATERYKFFIDNFPQWVNRVPKKDIAAFLGITPAHLSRIRL